MKWQGRRGSRNIEDRRGRGGARAGGMGVAGVLVVLAVGYFFGIDISPLVGGLEGPGEGSESRELTEEERIIGDYVSVVLADTEEVWSAVLPEQAGIEYREPVLVLFSGAVQSACGGASAAMGPFYCPGDERLYLDTDFFRVLEDKMGAGGDFAPAYVIAHEVGHHVQNLTGVLGETQRLRARLDDSSSNRLSVMTELQADCLAGLWARQVEDRLGVLDEDDLAEAITAAAAVGDDALARQAGRVPMPDSFTHGTAAQRQEWFRRGYETGLMEQCDTFAAARG